MLRRWLQSSIRSCLSGEGGEKDVLSLLGRRFFGISLFWGVGVALERELYVVVDEVVADFLAERKEAEL
jgi:hypothetical protein